MGTITTSLYVYGQTNSTVRDVSNDSNSTSGSNGSSSISNFARDKAIIDSTETKMIPVGDIYVAYKMFGKGSPVLLITGFRNTMDTWDPVMLNALAVNHTVITFDNRGMGKTTAGIKEFSIDQFANDTAGLIEALKIKNATVFGWSMGSHIAQDLVLKYPDKVNKLILYAADCGGKESIQRSPEVEQALTNTTGTAKEQGSRLLHILFPTQWLKQNPNVGNYFPIPTETSSITGATGQIHAIASWNGVCNTISKIIQPTLIITGTDDIIAPAANSLILVDKIPGAWLVQFKDAGHGLMYQYPEKLSRIVLIFLGS
jgi:pimeloyl-ACP methyl ester carboxylesterase